MKTANRVLKANPSSDWTRLFGDTQASPIWASHWDRDAVPEDSVSFSLPQLVRADMACLVVIRKGQVAWQVDGSHLQTLGGEESVHIVCDAQQRSELLLAGSEASSGLIIGMELPILKQLLTSFRPGLCDGFRDLYKLGGEGEATQLCSELVASAFSVDWLLANFVSCPVSGAARSFWYEGQIRILLSMLAFPSHPGNQSEEFFCSRQKRMSQDRIRQAKSYIEAHLGDKLNLKLLASRIGCSACYLSRTFSEETGMTLSQYLRKVRIERAAHLLVGGEMNVSETSVEVGYRSLSHFTKAFMLEKGCLPSHYRAA